MRELNVYKCSKLVKVYNNNETFYTDFKGVNNDFDNDENRRFDCLTVHNAFDEDSLISVNICAWHEGQSDYL